MPKLLLPALALGCALALSGCATQRGALDRQAQKQSSEESEGDLEKVLETITKALAAKLLIAPANDPSGTPTDPAKPQPRSNLAVSKVSTVLRITKVGNGGASIKVGVPPVDLAIDGSRTNSNDSTITIEFTPYGVSQAGWDAKEIPAAEKLVGPPSRVAPLSGQSKHKLSEEETKELEKFFREKPAKAPRR